MIISLERATKKRQSPVQIGLKECIFFSTSSSRFSKLCYISLEVSIVSIFGTSSDLNVFTKLMKVPITFILSFNLFCI